MFTFDGDYFFLNPHYKNSLPPCKNESGENYLIRNRFAKRVINYI